MRDRFFVRALRGSLPLWIWAAHFFISYALLAAECSPAAITPGAPSRWLLALLTVAALAACAVLLWRALPDVRRAAGAEPGLLAWAALGSAVLALAGVGWTAVPILMLDGCG